ncbi:PREDICTED: uncharacterized protein LOC109381813 isoform X3 [Hipposideros armiger]|uniref:Uncharacterized protein LOC109381813 isoform X3 n=1 Tax=Hipposideros armiger TaxID=186990 RepID=A0A8B7R608_HIPAR|nr:PREDICTED: uncharacterized protein LOC109381813 isoform X3 [Hipposideros armiger]
MAPCPQPDSCLGGSPLGLICLSLLLIPAAGASCPLNPTPSQDPSLSRRAGHLVSWWPPGLGVALGVLYSQGDHSPLATWVLFLQLEPTANAALASAVRPSSPCLWCWLASAPAASLPSSSWRLVSFEPRVKHAPDTWTAGPSVISFLFIWGAVSTPGTRCLPFRVGATPWHLHFLLQWPQHSSLLLCPMKLAGILGPCPPHPHPTLRKPQDRTCSCATQKGAALDMRTGLVPLPHPHCHLEGPGESLWGTASPASEAETLLCVSPGRLTLSPLTAFSDAAFSHCVQPLAPRDLAVIYALGPVSFLISLATCLALGFVLTACRTRRRCCTAARRPPRRPLNSGAGWASSPADPGSPAAAAQV